MQRHGPERGDESVAALEQLAVNEHANRDRDRQAANVRTGLTLGSIALVLFVGVFAARLIGSPVASIAVIGTAVLLFLVVAIGRHLRK